MLNFYLLDVEQETPADAQSDKLSPVAGFHPMAIQQLVQSNILDPRFGVMTKWRWNEDEIAELFEKTKIAANPWAEMLHHMLTRAQESKQDLVAISVGL